MLISRMPAMATPRMTSMETMRSAGFDGCVRSVRVSGDRRACSWIMPSHGIRPGPLSNGGCDQVEAHSGYAKTPAGAGVLLVAPTGVDPVTFRFRDRRFRGFLRDAMIFDHCWSEVESDVRLFCALSLNLRSRCGILEQSQPGSSSSEIGRCGSKV